MITVNTQYGYSRTGTEMVLVSITNPVGTYTYYFKLDEQRRIISVHERYAYFQPINYSFNLAGLFIAKVIDDLIGHYSLGYYAYSCTSDRPWAEVRAAKEVQGFFAGLGNLYNYPLWQYLNLSYEAYYLSRMLRSATAELATARRQLRDLKDRCRLLECMITDNVTYVNKTVAGRIREYVRRKPEVARVVTYMDGARFYKLAKAD